MNRKTLELWVGLFVAAGLMALAMLSFKVGNLAAGDVLDGYEVKAHFENIGGLKVKSPVTLAGVRIGRVKAITVDKLRYKAVVTFELDGRYRNIPSDSTAMILTSGLLGEQYIGIVPGADEDKYLKEGDKVFKTTNAVVLENLIGQVMVKLTEGSGKK